MKLKSLTSFSVGVLITALSVGTVNYVNAQSQRTINVCVNKKTGAMRYLEKGRCKKTEKKVTWNQMGLQGLQGVPGPQGPAGSPGEQVATDSSSSTAVTSVFDASGTYLGNLIGVSAGITNDGYDIAFGRYHFRLGDDGSPLDEVYYSESNCTGTPFVIADEWHKSLSRNRILATYINESTSARFFEFATDASVSPIQIRSRLGDNSIDGFTADMDGVGTCVNINWSNTLSMRQIRDFTPPFALDTSGPLRINTP